MPNTSRTSNIISSAFSAVSMNETSGNQAIACRITPPNPNSHANGKSGWTIGFNQEDFTNNPDQALATLKTALTASGIYNATSAINIAKALTAAGSSSNVSFNGITDVNGKQATIDGINAALQTAAAVSSIQQSSLQDFRARFNTLDSAVFQNSSLNSAVKSALADSAQGNLLKIALADFDNQYRIDPNGQMMQLLTAGSTTINGNTVRLDTTNAATITQSIMTMALDTQWTAKGNGAQACSRLANDVAAAVAFDTSMGVASPSTSETLASAYGQCTINQNANGATFKGTWDSGSFSGAATDSTSGGYDQFMTSEQVAAFNSAQNLTSIDNLINGISIGSGIVEGQATSAQLTQESQLASQLSGTTRLADAQSSIYGALGIASDAATTQAMGAADRNYTGNPATPSAYGGANYVNFLNGLASNDNVFAQSSARSKAVVADLAADPTPLALEDGVLAVKMARNNPSVINTLTALQKVLLAGGVSVDLSGFTGESFPQNLYCNAM